MADYSSSFTGAQIDNAVQANIDKYAVEIVGITTNRTMLSTDVGKDFHANSASDITLTIQPQSSGNYPSKSYFFATRRGAGNVIIAPGAGVTLISVGSKLKIAETNATVCIRQTETTDTWMVTGYLKA